MSDNIYLYFEPQQAALCAVHAINTLLQGPYTNEIDLSEIALALDQMERELLGGEAFAEHGNVDNTGMFNISVVGKYLEDLWGLAVVSLNSPEASAAKADPVHEQAFIANLEEHWFCIRNVYGEWYNFNSLFAAPEPLSPFYLSAFLASLQDQGYSIYVIKGQLPSEPHPEAGSSETHSGKWFTPQQAKAATLQTQQIKKQGVTSNALQNVIDMASSQGTRMTLRSGNSAAAAGGSQQHQRIEADDLAKALAASRQQQPSNNTSGGGNGGGDVYIDDEDADLAAAIAASLADTQPPPSQPSPPPSSDAVVKSSEVKTVSPAPLVEEEQAMEASQDFADQQPPLKKHIGDRQQQQQEQVVVVGDGDGSALKSHPVDVVDVDMDMNISQTQQQQQDKQTNNDDDGGQEKKNTTSNATTTVELVLRLPDGRRCRHSFSPTDTVETVLQYAVEQGQGCVDIKKHRLTLPFPRKVLNDLSQSLSDAGVEDKQMLNVEVCL